MLLAAIQAINLQGVPERRLMQEGHRQSHHLPRQDSVGEIAEHIGVARVVHVPVVIEVGVDNVPLAHERHVLHRRHRKAHRQLRQGDCLIARKTVVKCGRAEQPVLADVHQRPERHALRHDLPLAQNPEAPGRRGAVPVHDPGLAVEGIVGVKLAVNPDGNAAEQERQPLLVAQTVEEAKAAVRSMIEDKAFGQSGARVVIEEFMEGPEVSVLSFTDGETVVPMVSSMDHKCALDGDKGPNTGGMGVYSPVPIVTDEEHATMVAVMEQTVAELAAEGIDYRGCLYGGFMLTPAGPKVLEFNARFGDPETQVVLPRLKNDLVEVMLACANCELDQIELDWRDEWAVAVVLTSAGYPGSYEKGKVITGIEDVEAMENVTVYHAGTAVVDGQLVTNGGRVLAVTALGDTFENARNLAYEACEKIDFEGKTLRHDIGLRALRGRDAWDA
mgnify:CR=1 FL=1